MRMRLAACVCTTFLAIGAAACGGGSRTVTVEIPPRLDLSDFARVGLATFTVENAKGGLHELATRRFAEQVLEATRGVEVLELSDTDAVLRQASESTFGPASARVRSRERDARMRASLPTLSASRATQSPTAGKSERPEA